MKYREQWNDQRTGFYNTDLFHYSPFVPALHLTTSMLKRLCFNVTEL